MRTSLLTICAATLVASGAAWSQTSSFAGLGGHSISAEYKEEVMTGRAGSFRLVWREQVYFSTKGRIFHRSDRRSSRPDFERQSENISDPDGQGDGREAKFRWVSDGIVREFTTPRGIHIRHSIAISRSGGGFTCRVTIERSASRFTPSADELGQSCRVVKGNIIAGR